MDSIIENSIELCELTEPFRIKHHQRHCESEISKKNRKRFPAMAVKEKSETDDMELTWNTEEEVQLLYALDGLKPVGINKHFYMARICERLSKALKREVASESVWAHLRTLYNLDVLDQMERLPFTEEQVEFSLPESEYSALISKKLAETDEKKLPETKTEAIIKSKCFHWM